MRIGKLAFHNFQKSFQHYFSMILSLAFTVLILYNFVNLTYAETFQALGERNKEYIDIIIRVVSFVLVCFLFFFIWYATNVFLTRRKKEIGIYVFMGLTNRKIGSLYLLESVMMGVASLALGVCSGVITTQLFQMILLAVSDITMEIAFRFSLQAVLLTALIYGVIYFIFVIKGYVSIVRSSVLEMISAAKQNESVKSGRFLLFVKAVSGIGILVYGYYTAVQESGTSVLGKLFGATVLVIIGTYFVFGGFLPLLFQSLARKKLFLYQKERNLWVNNIVFRMRKNYRSYAMTCVLLTCSVSALAASFAEKGQYDNMVNFRNTYSFQIVSSYPDLEEEVTKQLGGEAQIEYHASLPCFGLDGSYFSHGYTYGMLAYSDVRRLAEATGLEFPYEELADDELICLTHIYLMSLITERSDVTVGINGKTYRQIDTSTVPYLGYMQESQSYYIVSDRTYEELFSAYQQETEHPEQYYKIYTYHYKIADTASFDDCLAKLQQIVSNTEDGYVGLAAFAPDSDDIQWIKVEYSLCVFMFFVFVLASGSILFMKLYNDAFEEKERYATLKKIGISDKSLGRAIARELWAAYLMPFLLMALSSCFAIHALEKMMTTNLKMVNLVSVLIVFVILAGFYLLSVMFYKRNVGIDTKNTWF